MASTPIPTCVCGRCTVNHRYVCEDSQTSLPATKSCSVTLEPSEMAEVNLDGEFGDKEQRRHSNAAGTLREIRKRLVNTGQAKFVSSRNEPAPRSVQPRPCPNGHPKKPIYKCDSVSDDQREQMLKAYWGLNSKSGRWSFEAQSIVSSAPKRSKAAEVKSVANKYFLTLPTNEKVRVCKEFYNATLDISYHKAALTKKVSENDIRLTRASHPPANKVADAVIEIARQRLWTFPRLPFHFCRAQAKKYYLGDGMSMSMLYNDFKAHCGDVIPSVSWYRNWFNYSTNFGLSKPKKCDQCRLHCQTAEQKRHEGWRAVSKAKMTPDIQLTLDIASNCSLIKHEKHFL